jgi:hypothetical protein
MESRGAGEVPIYNGTAPPLSPVTQRSAADGGDEGVPADSALGRSLLDFSSLVRQVREEAGGRLRAAQAAQLRFETLLQLLPDSPTAALLFPAVRARLPVRGPPISLGSAVAG